MVWKKNFFAFNKEKRFWRNENVQKKFDHILRALFFFDDQFFCVCSGHNFQKKVAFKNPKNNLFAFKPVLLFSYAPAQLFCGKFKFTDTQTYNVKEYLLRTSILGM